MNDYDIYNGSASGAQIDAAVSKALNPDTTPTANSSNLVTSGGVAAALATKATTSALNALSAVVNTKASASDLMALQAVVATKADDSDLAALETVVAGKQDALTFDNVPTANSANPVKSGGVFSSEEALKQMILASFPTDTISNAPIAFFPDGADDIPVKSLTVNVTPVQAVGTPTPEAPLPISGWTGAKVYQGGIALSVSTTGGSLDDNGEEVPSSNYKRTGFIDISAFQSILTSVSSTSTSGWYERICLYDRDKQFLSLADKEMHGSPNTFNHVIQTNGAAYVRMSVKAGAGTSVPDIFGSGKLYEVSWQSDAGTVHGGTLRDNGDGTWTLAARPYYAEYAGEALVGPWVSSMDVYAEGVTPTTGAQVVDLGGTETTYTLTAESVKTLLGSNNIFADTGDVASLVYRADVGLYIAKKLGENT